LTSLPEELIDRIVFLTDARPTLHALTLVSKDLNRITTPHLYSAIALTNTDFQYLRPLAYLLWTSLPHRALVKVFSVRRAYGGNLAPWPQCVELEGVLRDQI
ncbi:hypothetical protein P153DRAFT_252435, partial [Dothidotthia symphoricarpi CBS 119687]